LRSKERREAKGNFSKVAEGDVGRRGSMCGRERVCRSAWAKSVSGGITTGKRTGQGFRGMPVRLENGSRGKQDEPEKDMDEKTKRSKVDESRGGREEEEQRESVCVWKKKKKKKKRERVSCSPQQVSQWMPARWFHAPVENRPFYFADLRSCSTMLLWLRLLYLLRTDPSAIASFCVDSSIFDAVRRIAQ
jgi:hypothetical protein